MNTLHRNKALAVTALACAGLAFCWTPCSAQDAEDILGQAGVTGGIVVHLGSGDGTLTADLLDGEQYLVQGLDTDADAVAAARARLLEDGVYGPVSVDVWDGERLPYADNLVNLIVAEDPADAPDAELLRVLAPRGVVLVQRDGRWEKTVKPWPDEMDEWTHYLHSADGNPVADDSLVGPPTRLQWVGGPSWARHHDHMASMTSLVSSGGRLFYIFDEGSTASVQLPPKWRLIARDAFNGTVLWKRDIDRWNTTQYPLKSGPAHLLRRLVAIGDRVYVTLGIDEPTVALDAVTGETVETYEGSEFTREIVASDGVLFLVADTSPSSLPDYRRQSTYVWANTQAANPGWGWGGEERQVLAYDGDSGRQLWKAEHPVAPCSLAADERRVVFHDGDELVCLDRDDGDTVWTSAAKASALPVQTNTGPRVVLYDDVVLFAGNNGWMSGYSAEDGARLWEQEHRPSGHMSLKDLLVVDGLVWTAAIAGNQDDGVFIGYDPATGETKRSFEPDVNLHWFHHRCYPSKGAGKYILSARNGTEYVDMEKETWRANHWVRGGCIYGVMPCNGLTYASMNSCGCQMEAKLIGFNALASGPVPEPTPAHLDPATRLQRGPAYGEVDGPAASDDDWPTYRHDEARSGATTSAVSADLGEGWDAELDGKLTAPTIAAGMALIASTDTHTLHALDADTGEKLWSYFTGGPIDSPPTYYNGLVLCGSADGYVYALRGTDGALAWRFRGAPLDRRIMAWERIESVWPIHGSVLVHGGVLYCTAGRNMYLDGGLHFLRLDAMTGELLGEVVMDDKDPLTGQDMHLAYLEKTPGNVMPVAHSDILSYSGDSLWLRSQKIDLEGNRSELEVLSPTQQENEGFHVFCQTGFLDDSWFFRSYWTYGRRMGGGYGGWYQAGRVVPSGRILCFDDDAVYGFGRKPEYMVNSSVIEYQLYAADKAIAEEAIQRVNQANREMNSRSNRNNANSSDWLVRHFYDDEDLTAARFGWSFDQPAVLARAMVATADTLFVAGPPDLIDERYAYRNPDDDEVAALLARQEAALDGGEGGELWALSKSDGRLLARYALETIPVFDGLAAAGGRLYMTTVDGKVHCVAGTGEGSLPRVEGKPEQVLWDEPEDPGYLLPLPEPREGDFAQVTGCEVFSSQLGYRLRGKGTDIIGAALNTLAEPLTGTVTLRTRLVAAADAQGLLRNGFLAFGNGLDASKLIKCGVRIQAKQAIIALGPLKGGKSVSEPIEAPGNAPLELVVRIDLGQQKVTCSVGGVTIEAEVAEPLESISTLGYVMDNALIDFGPIEIEKE